MVDDEAKNRPNLEEDLFETSKDLSLAQTSIPPPENKQTCSRSKRSPDKVSTLGGKTFQIYCELLRLRAFCHVLFPLHSKLILCDPNKMRFMVEL